MHTAHTKPSLHNKAKDRTTLHHTDKPSHHVHRSLPFASHAIQRLRQIPQQLGSGDMVYLQRTIGNQAVVSLLGRAGSPGGVQPTPTPLIQRTPDIQRRWGQQDPFKAMVGPSLQKIGDSFPLTISNLTSSITSAKRVATEKLPRNLSATALLQRFLGYAEAFVEVGVPKVKTEKGLNPGKSMANVKKLAKSSIKAEDRMQQGKTAAGVFTKAANKFRSRKILRTSADAFKDTAEYVRLKFAYDQLADEVGRSVLSPVSPKKFLAYGGREILANQIEGERDKLKMQRDQDTGWDIAVEMGDQEDVRGSQTQDESIDDEPIDEDIKFQGN